MSTYTATERARRQRLKFDKNAVQRTMVTISKRRAAQSGLSHDIDVEYIKSIWPVDDKCPVFGCSMLVEDRFDRPSLDRIDTTRGYVRGNVCIISYKANSLKSNGSLHEFEAVLGYMHRLGAT